MTTATSGIAGDIQGDPINPGGEGAFFAVMRSRSIETQEDLLTEVGRGRWPREARKQATNAALPAAHDLLERGRVSGLPAAHQLGIARRHASISHLCKNKRGWPTNRRKKMAALTDLCRLARIRLLSAGPLRRGIAGHAHDAIRQSAVRVL